MPARSRRLRSRLIVGTAVLVAVGAVGGVAYARAGGSPAYRTTAVTTGSVTSTLDLVGTVSSVQTATVGFAQSGTVVAVDVKLGDQVTTGQTLAQLDLTSLQTKLTQARATEAAARQTLTGAENGQLPSGNGGSTGASPTSDSASGGRAGESATSAATAGIKTAQQGVVSAQKSVDDTLGGSHAALATAASACGSSAAPAGGPANGDPGAGASAAAGPRSSASPTSTAPAASPSPAAAPQTDTAACLAAETAVLSAESDLSTKQAALQKALTDLSQALTTASAPTTTVTSGSAGAAQLAQYQAALDADTAAVAVAQQNLAQGTAVSPLAGTVVSVGVSPGDRVAAASQTAVIMISAPDQQQVVATVPTADIAQVTTGQHASVTPDGGSTPIQAVVTTIAATPGSSGYPIVLGLPRGGSPLREGASASVQLTTGTASSGTVVPTSAIQMLGTRRFVEVLANGTVQPTVVTTGIMGPTQTQVLSGLTSGQQVVLADLSSTVTSDSSTSTDSRGALTGSGSGSGRGLGGGGGGARTGSGRAGG